MDHADGRLDPDPILEEFGDGAGPEVAVGGVVKCIGAGRNDERGTSGPQCGRNDQQREGK